MVETRLVRARRDARRPGDGGGSVALRDHRQGGRRPADGAVRDVRRVRDAGDRRLRRHQAGQARRARGARRRRQPGADHRHAGQRDHLARRGRHGPGHVRDLLRRDRRPERRVRVHRRHVRLRAAGRLGRRRRHHPQPPRGLVAGLRRRARSRSCCCRRAPPAAGCARRPPTWPGNWPAGCAPPRAARRPSRRRCGPPRSGCGPRSPPRRTARPGWPPPTRRCPASSSCSSGARRRPATRSTGTST